MAKILLDSSAVLAALFNEPGADLVRVRGEQAAISAANYTEVLCKLADRGVPTSDAEAVLSSLNLEIVGIDAAAARRAASFRARTRPHGFSLGDLLCLACASCRSIPVLTADRRWTAVDLGVEVVTIRP